MPDGATRSRLGCPRNPAPALSHGCEFSRLSAGIVLFCFAFFWQREEEGEEEGPLSDRLMVFCGVNSQ